MAFVSNPRRDASPIIAGFVFQVNVTIVRWLELQNGEHLELECGEDIDTIQQAPNGENRAEQRLLEQIKARSNRPLTLRSEEALQALANFCGHRASNPTLKFRFRYLTTADSGVEKGWDRPESGIETWAGVRRGRYDEVTRADAMSALRTLLRSCNRPEKVRTETWQAMQEVLASDDNLTEVILAFEWGLEHGDYSQTEKEILEMLDRDGRVDARGNEEKIYEHLFAFVFRLLCRPGPKLLNIDQLNEELRVATSDDLSVMELVRSELGQLTSRVGIVEAAVVQHGNDLAALKQTVDKVGKSLGLETSFALRTVSLSSDLPDLINPCAQRDSLTSKLLGLAQATSVVVLTAEPGAGKTQLLLLAIRKSNRRPRWLSIPRDATEAQACMLLDALVQSIASGESNLQFRERCADAAVQFRDGVVVVEDLPRMVPGGHLAARIEALARSLKNVNAYLFASTYFRLPALTEQALGNVHLDVPRFTADDAAELLTAAEAPQHLRTETIQQLLIGVTEGLPTLVMAAVRYLATQNWNFTNSGLESFFRGEFASPHRHDARSLLHITVPDPQERELLIRLSLAIGVFTMDDISYVARVRSAIPLPGEKVQRATGVWLQKVGSDRFLRSPLITSNFADSLDPTTRKGVHFVLALRILARKTLEPIEVFTCVYHLMMAEDATFAVLIAIKMLMAFLELNEPFADDFGFSWMWPDAPVGVDENLQVCLRSLQIVVLAKLGRNNQPMVDKLDALIADLGDSSWGTVVGAITLAINLVRQSPGLANKYLLKAIRGFATGRLPDGSEFPRGDYPLENLIWASALNCKSDADIDSWLETIRSYTPAQVEITAKSELMDDNVTILCDGVWLREYLKSEPDRDWAAVRRKLREIEATASAIGLPTLEAAAIRTNIMVLTEWEKQLPQAVSLSESSIERFDRDDCRFLVMEVTGRQLAYAGQTTQAVMWLERALSCRAYSHSALRRNVLITLAGLYSFHERSKAREFTSEAVRISKDGRLVEPLFIETLAEHGIALWKAGERVQSFETFEEVTNRLFATQADSDAWRGQFFRIFVVIAYFSGVALNGKPQEGHIEPEQGLFLSSKTDAHTGYRIEQLAYICVRLAMFADGVKNISKAAIWTWKAVELAKQIPTATDAVRLSSPHAIPSTLLSDDFVRYGELVRVMTAIDVESILGTQGRASKGISTSDQTAGTESLCGPTPGVGNKSALSVIPIVPGALRLAVLQMHGDSGDAVIHALEGVESVLPVDVQLEEFVAKIKRALVDEIDWRALWDEGCSAISNQQYVSGHVLCIGAITRAAASESLCLQVYLAENLEGFFKHTPSIYREIVAPFFVAYWDRATTQSVGVFRTALAYTRQQFQLSDGSPGGTRKLLNAMRFCLGVQLPQRAQEWLDASH